MAAAGRIPDCPLSTDPLLFDWPALAGTLDFFWLRLGGPRIRSASVLSHDVGTSSPSPHRLSACGRRRRSLTLVDLRRPSHGPQPLVWSVRRRWSPDQRPGMRYPTRLTPE